MPWITREERQPRRLLRLTHEQHWQRYACLHTLWGVSPEACPGLKEDCARTGMYPALLTDMHKRGLLPPRAATPSSSPGDTINRTPSPWDMFNKTPSPKNIPNKTPSPRDIPIVTPGPEDIPESIPSHASPSPADAWSGAWGVTAGAGLPCPQGRRGRVLAVMGTAAVLGMLLLYILAEHSQPHVAWWEWHLLLGLGAA